MRSIRAIKYIRWSEGHTNKTHVLIMLKSSDELFYALHSARGGATETFATAPFVHLFVIIQTKTLRIDI